MTSAAFIDVELLPSDGGELGYAKELQKDISELPRVPAPIYRHAAPSAPWPWMDFDVDASEVHPLPPGGLSQDPEWRSYPQSLFGNWTHDQVARCGILKAAHNETCSVHKVDVFSDGSFDRSEEDCTITIEDPRDYWNHLEMPPPLNVRVRALFVENISLNQARYNIEPSFFASSANWIPSRYEEDPKSDGDHITVVLPFIRVMRNQKPIERTRLDRTATFLPDLYEDLEEELLPYKDEKQIIDTQAPLLLPDNKIIVQDLLAIHMHRTPKTSTIVSYHPSSELQRTSAKRLQSLVQRTGDSVYWSKIYQRSRDPTFVFLAILWYALYAWDETFEVLYYYINALESEVLRNDNTKLIRELHRFQAHLLYYEQLLRDFRVSVEFVRAMRNPAMSVLASPEEQRDSLELLNREVHNLLSEIERLGGQRQLLTHRLENVIHLKLATTTMTDSTAMKQISYFTMIFLPANFIANVFSMNVREINPPTTETIARYTEAVVGLTFLTLWVMIALQRESAYHPPNCNTWKRAFWPVFYVSHLISAAREKRR